MIRINSKRGLDRIDQTPTRSYHWVRQTVILTTCIREILGGEGEILGEEGTQRSHFKNIMVNYQKVIKNYYDS